MEADGFRCRICLYQVFQNAEFSFGIDDSLSYVGLVGRFRVVIDYFCAMYIDAIADSLPCDMISGTATVVENVLAQVDKVNAHGVAVNFLDFAASRLTRAHVVLPVYLLGVSDDEQVNIGIGRKVAPGAGSEQDDGVGMDHVADRTGDSAGFGIGMQLCCSI